MVRVPKALQAKVEAKLRECVQTASEHFDRSFEFPTVLYTKKGTTAGTAHSRTNTINLNAVLLIENEDTFINRTVVHEFAHLVDAAVNPQTRRGGRRSVHGPTWKRIMKLFGADDSRCHSYDVTNARQRKRVKERHVWVCGCGAGKILLTPRQHHVQLQMAQKGYGLYSRGHTPKKCGLYTYQGKVVL